MTFTMTSYDGKQFSITEPLAWRLEYGLGTPCDSFWVKFLWTEGREDVLADGVRMTVTQGTTTLFTGIVDEGTTVWSDKGRVAEISGRGLQGLLLDNQAEAVDFVQASLSDILRRYVTPYGIRVARAGKLPPVWGFSVSSGSSCWKVLYQFARYHAGVTPRFDRQGRLDLSPWQDSTPKVIDKSLPVVRLAVREKRYGVLSQVTVKDVTGWREQTEENAAFRARGGRSRRVILMPKDTGWQARRYQAKFQLARSAAELRTVEVTVAGDVSAWPGELVRVTGFGWARNGVYRVAEKEIRQEGKGQETVLVLVDRNAVL